MNLSQLEWITSFVGCCISHQVFKSYGLTDNISNICSCIVFQIFFVYSSGYLVYNEIIYGTNDPIESSKNLRFFYGYFIYDILYLVNEENLNRNKSYILHHIVSCMMIDMTLNLNLKKTFYQNAFVFVSEFTNPIINNRILLKNYPNLKKINKRVMKYSYFICRVVSFPLLATGFLYTSEIEIYTKSLLGFCFTGIYLSTIIWFKKIVT